jgi:beta-N-acetylhexosaminidase
MNDGERLAGSVLVAGFAGSALPDTIAGSLRDGALAGVILFKRNLSTLEALAALSARIAETSVLPPLNAIDQEGGRVARLTAPVVKLPPARLLGRIDDVALTERAGELLARQLRALGINVDFAPVLDVDTNPANPIIGDRAYGTSPDVVIRHARAMARGLARGAVLACGKHFPGHGDTELDSHLDLPRIAHDRARLDATELAPFRALAKELPTIMTAHVVFDAIDRTLPATLCREVIEGVLRRELGYDGIIVSDDLEMRAVKDRWGVADGAVRAIDAGCDLLLVCEHEDDLRAAQRALAERASRDETFHARLARASARVEALRRSILPAPIDPTAVDPSESRALEDEIARRASLLPSAA